MNIYEKINAIMENVESLQKDGKVAFGSTKYNFLSEAKTTAEMRKQLVKYKLVILPIGVEEKKEGSITQGKYTYKVVNAENPEEFIILESGGQGHDSADKGSGKASSYAYKYLMWRTFAIPSNDDPDMVSSDEIAEAKKKIAKAETDTQADMPASEKVDTKQIISEVQAQALLQLALDTKSSVSDLCKYYEVKDLNELNMEQWLGAKKILDKRVAENKKKV